MNYLKEKIKIQILNINWNFDKQPTITPNLSIWRVIDKIDIICKANYVETAGSLGNFYVIK